MLIYNISISGNSLIKISKIGKIKSNKDFFVNNKAEEAQKPKYPPTVTGYETFI